MKINNQEIEDIFSPDKLCDGCEQHYGFCIKAKPEFRITPCKYSSNPREIPVIIPLKEDLAYLNHLGIKKEHEIKALNQLQLGHDFFQQKDYENAHIHYINALELNFQHSQGHLYIAKCFYKLSQFDNAIDYAIKSSINFTLTEEVESFILMCENELIKLQ